jgi:class 3 adenylate cyclase
MSVTNRAAGHDATPHSARGAAPTQAPLTEKRRDRNRTRAEFLIVLGHRRKLLRAIAALNTGRAASAGPSASDAAAMTAAAAPTAGAAAPSPSAAPNIGGERRYLTVLFCDLVGSTGISAQLDAEEWRDLVGAYLDTASAAVAEMGGKVAKKLGDGVLGLFGYPVAQENDAERAARAAREANFNTSNDLAAGEIAAQRHANVAVTSRRTPQPKFRVMTSRTCMVVRLSL